MIIEFLIAYGVGVLLSVAIAEIFITVYEHLSAYLARKKAEEELGTKLGRLFVTEKREYGETIDLKAYSQSGEHIANITFSYENGTSLRVGEAI